MSILISKAEADKHLTEIEIVGNSFHLIHKEWKERGTHTLDVNPFYSVYWIKMENLSKSHQIFKK
jgi:hypothetical protein